MYGSMDILLFFFYLAFGKGTKFAEAAKKANLIPLYQCIFSDHLTPVVAHQILLEDDDREAPSFLFESDELSCDVVSILAVS